MKVIIPLAGLGTRLRPHTYSKPKPLIEVAGKPMLAHILDELVGLEIEELIFIVGHLSEQIEEYVRVAYPQYRARYILQKELLGQSPAVYLAKKYISGGDILIIFSDTIFKTDLTTLAQEQGDGVLHLKAVEDPARFGVAVIDEAGFVTRLVEKPTIPVSNLAVVGVYYIKDSNWLFRSIERQLSQPSPEKGEFFLADAFSIMLQEEAHFKSRSLQLWEDCGTIEALLDSNRVLLKTKGNYQTGPVVKDSSLIIPPVYLAPGAVIERSIIGPNVSIADGARISDAIIKDSIIHQKAIISNILLTNSVIGSNSKIAGTYQQLNLGDAGEFGSANSPQV